MASFVGRVLQWRVLLLPRIIFLKLDFNMSQPQKMGTEELVPFLGTN